MERRGFVERLGVVEINSVIILHDLVWFRVGARSWKNRVSAVSRSILCIFSSYDA